MWQLLTSAFTHLDLWHIGFNMVALWVLGPQLEVVLGRTRFLAVYLLSALSGSVCVYWLSGISTPTIGASGAIFGLMGALLVVAFKVRANVQQLLLWIGLNFLITVIGRVLHLLAGPPRRLPRRHAGRCGVRLRPPGHRARWQLAGVAGLVAALLGLAVVARTAVLT